MSQAELYTIVAFVGAWAIVMLALMAVTSVRGMRWERRLLSGVCTACGTGKPMGGATICRACMEQHRSMFR